MSDTLTFSIKSHSSPGQSYKVSLDTFSGTWYCPCKGYGYRRTCSHIKEAIAQLDKQTEQLVANLEVSTKLLQTNHCKQCGVALSGTHAFLDQCAACIRATTFA